ncbi:hypothetical protein BJ508DRAFT_358457 [Ascobolus immersus RN42]|uniref:Uncharacterized protein n=1 Tax=Ascobolus immersus RN42 TaxID=1160509 RepID=A0A3N4IQ52_ASCIM|nr:hypothetical protein BJ508DRAFT_358457 [Ascobolus immersus RN42]
MEYSASAHQDIFTLSPSPLLVRQHTKPPWKLQASPTLWNKGFEWAFSNGLILLVDKADSPMEMKRSTNPHTDAQELQNRLTGDTTAATGPVYILSPKTLDLYFPCPKDEVLVRYAYYSAYRESMKAMVRETGERSLRSVGERRLGATVKVTGSSGIGKSFFLTFCLIIRLLEGKRTIYQQKDSNEVHVFDSTGHHLLPKEHYTTNLDMDSSIIAISDAAPESRNMIGSVGARDWPILYSAVADTKRYKIFTKGSRPRALNMDIPTKLELDILNSVLKIFHSAFESSRLDYLYTHFNPSLTFLKQLSAQSLDPSFRKIIDKAKDIVRKKHALLPLMGLELFDDTDSKQGTESLSRIVVLRPTKNTDMGSILCPVSWSASYEYVAATTTIWFLLSRAAAELGSERAKDFRKMLESRGRQVNGEGVKKAWEGYMELRWGAGMGDVLLKEVLFGGGVEVVMDEIWEEKPWLLLEIERRRKQREGELNLELELSVSRKRGWGEKGGSGNDATVEERIKRAKEDVVQDETEEEDRDTHTRERVGL